MATNVGTLSATIGADVSGLRSGGDQAISILKSIDASIKQLVKGSSGINSAFNSTGKQARQMAKDANAAKASISALDKTLNSAASSLRNFAAGYLAVQTVKDVIKSYVDTADGIKLINSRLKIAASSQEEYNASQRELLRISNDTGTALNDTVTLYTRFERSTRDLGTSQKELFGILETINQTVAISGANSAEASNALIQFSQGLASGTLRGEELNSVLEQLPALARTIAQGMGVAYGDLRKLAAQGEITPAKIIKAIQSQAKAVDKEFKQIEVTVGRSLIVAANNAKVFIGAVDEATGFSKNLSNAILGVAKALETMDPASTAAALSALIGTVKTGTEVFLAYAAVTYGPAAIAGAAKFVTSTIASVSAQLQLNAAVSAGTATMLGSTGAIQARAAYELEQATATATAAEATFAKARADVAAAEAQVAATTAEVQRTKGLISQTIILRQGAIMEAQHAKAVTAAAEAEAALAAATTAATEAQLASVGAAAAQAKAVRGVATAATAGAGAMAIFAKAANAALLVFVGFELAKYFRDNFDAGKRFFIGVADVAIKSWYSIELTYKAGTATLGSLWDELINGIKKTYAEFLTVYAAGTEFVTGKTNEELRKTIVNLRIAAEGGKTLGDKLKDIRLEFADKLEKHNAQIVAMYEGVGKTSKALEKFNKEGDNAAASSNAAAEALKKFREQLQQLLDRLLPLQALNRQYAADLGVLNQALSSGALGLKDYGDALSALNAEYKKSRQAIAEANVSEIRDQYRELGKEYERQIELQNKLRSAFLLQIETQRDALATAEQLGEVSGVEAAQQRIQLLQQELDLHKQIYSEIAGSSPDAQLLRAEELQSIQEINNNIRGQQQIIADSTWIGGAKKAWKEYSDAALNAGQQSYDFFSRTFSSLEDAVIEFTRTGKLNFEDFAKSVLEDLLRIQVRAIAVQAITAATGLTSGLFFHNGMEPSFRPPPRFHSGLEPAVQVPRFHDGLKPDEFQAILQVGERVTSKRDVESQNRELQQFEMWKLSNGRGSSSPSVTIDASTILDPSYSKRFREEIKTEQEDMFSRLIRKHFGIQ